MHEDNVKAIQEATALLLQDLAQRTSEPGQHREALSLRSRVLYAVEQAIAARPGFQNTTVFDEPTAAWGRSATAPTPDAEAFADGRFVEAVK